jgi:cytosine/adenosine deaminase-related metal-dependent hydrolase
MKLRKISADKIFDGYRLRTGSMLVMEQGGRIVDLIADDGSAERLDGLLMPGMVNCHCHLELSHMKGLIPEKTGLVDFVYKVVTERHHATEMILQAIEEAENEMKANGIVAVGDICNNTSTIAQKQKGNLLYYNFIEASAWLPSVAQQRFERAKDLLTAFSEVSGLTAASAVVPHAPYSVSGELWQKLQPLYRKKVVSIHNQETAFEDAFFQQGTGDFVRMYQMMHIDNSHHRPTNKTSLQSYYDLLVGADTIILVHNTFTTSGDIQYIQQRYGDAQRPQTYFCLCVNANLYIEDSLPPIELFRSSGCPVVLGTDSLASNGQLSILEEIRTIKKHWPLIDLEELLQWATINGAKALAMEDRIGSFEKGKAPGVVLINEDTLTVQSVLA